MRTLFLVSVEEEVDMAAVINDTEPDLYLEAKEELREVGKERDGRTRRTDVAMTRIFI